MGSPPVPPATVGRPPEEGEPRVDRGRRERIVLIAATVLAVVAAAAAGYAISEIESTKDENREDDRAVANLRADLDVFREQMDERVEKLQGQLGDTAAASSVRRIEADLDKLDKRVSELDQQDDGGESDQISTRVDDLEKRIEDLENDDSSN